MKKELRDEMLKSLESMITLESILSDLNVIQRVDRKDDENMEGTRLKSNSHIIKTSYVPPCKLIKNDIKAAHIPVPETDQIANATDSKMMSAEEARKYGSLIKQESVKQVTEQMLCLVNREMRKDIKNNPSRVLFEYEVPVGGLIDSSLAIQLCDRITTILNNLEYRDVTVKYISKVIPLLTIKFSL